MGQKWGEEQEAYMEAHYVSAASVEEVAQALGRTPASVIKKGTAMGLNRGSQQQRSIRRLMDVLSDSPMSVAEIAAAIGISQGGTSDLLIRCHNKELCHIAGHLDSARGKKKPLWIAGKGENVKTDYAIGQEARKQRVEESPPLIAFRDPLQAAMFGSVSAIQSALVGRIYRQSMAVSEDEVEVAC